MKYAYIDSDLVLIGWGYAAENGADTVVPVDDDFALEKGSWKYINGGWQAYTPSAPVPQSVTAAQGGIALIQASLMTSVQAAADSADTPAEVKWAWERAQTWERDSAALAYLARKANITGQQMDALFVAAQAIQA